MSLVELKLTDPKEGLCFINPDHIVRVDLFSGRSNKRWFANIHSVDGSVHTASNFLTQDDAINYISKIVKLETPK